MSAIALPPLRRGSLARPPVRIVHLGLGAFHRAHQAWYTARAEDADHWGIAAFTGRTPEQAETLAAQDCVYTVAERSPEGDHHRIVASIVAAHDASELTALRDYLEDPSISIVTLTVTEKGYHLNSQGALDTSDADITADIDTLRHAFSHGAGLANGALRTMPARLVWGLGGRHRANAGVLAIIPCDNLSSNGAAARASIHGMAALTSPELAAWLDDTIDFVSTSVDRITPRITDEDKEKISAELGYLDAAPVVTEAFSSWILSGQFRAARPAWESAGAEFVDHIDAFENRKLWMLNGAHSLLAYLGVLRGHTTVAEAMADPECEIQVHQLWDLVERHLLGPELRLPEYRRSLADRFQNAAIVHTLRQIAIDGSSKLPNRVVELVRLDRTSGGTGDAALRVIAAWIAFVLEELRAERPLHDAASAQLQDAATAADPIRSLLAVISTDLAASDQLVDELRALLP